MSKLTHPQQFVLACCREEDRDSFFSLPNEWLLDAPDKRLHKFVREYYIKYSGFPPRKDIKAKFKLTGDYSAEPGHYYSEMQEDYVSYMVVTYLPTAVKDFEKAPLKKLTELRTYLSSIKTKSGDTVEVAYSDHATARYDTYKQRQGTGGVVYMSTGNAVLDALIYGYEPTDLITFGGRAGTLKTWLMVQLALAAETSLPEHYGPILFITNEMSVEQINERFDCARFHLCYEDYLKGELTRLQTRQYYKELKLLEKEGSPIIVLDNVLTLSDLEEKMVIYQPSIVFVDGSYLLEPQMEEGYAKTVFITRNLKRVAKAFKVPLLNTTQLRKNSGKKAQKSSADAQDDFYHGSYTQDSDFAFRMFRDARMELNMQVGIGIAKGRRVPPGTEVIWTNNFVTLDSTFELVEPDPVMIEEEEEEIL